VLGLVAPPLPGLVASPGGVAPLVLAPPPALLPGAGAPVALPDLGAMARDALAAVTVEPAETGPPPPTRTAAIPPPPPRTAAIPPPPPPLPPAIRPRALPPPPAAPVPSATPRRIAARPGGRDLAQRIGDALYPLLEPAGRNYKAAFVVAALFGLTVPIVLLRKSFDVRVRLGLSFVVFWIWLSLVVALF
jgi:hypothetical protein